MQKLFVDTPEALQDLCLQLEHSSWLALDTEFMREKTYYPEFCLLQISDGKITACVDPLSIEDLAPLKKVLFDERITKVFHAAKQDLEILYLLWGALPSPVFDTQLAATLFGLGDQIGYANLVEQLLNKRLAKGHTRTDWSRRPLDDAQVRYAFDDVIDLGQVYEKLAARLEAKDRTHWLDADFRDLSDPETYMNRPEEAWSRVKGNQHLKGLELAVLQSLAEWREKEAQHSDKPKRWILKDEVLIDLARRQPSTTDLLSRIRGIESGVIRRRGDLLLQLVQKARERPEESWPKSRKTLKRLTPNQEAITDLLACALRLIGEENGVTASALGTRKELERLVSGDEQVPLLHGWRKEVAGDSLLDVLAGTTVPRLVDGKLQLRSSQQDGTR